MAGHAADTYTTVGYSSPSFSAGLRPAVLVVDFQWPSPIRGGRSVACR